MAVTAVIGAQWGDEGKGKLAHILSQHHDYVLRYQGGSNAGHTVKADGQVYKFKLVPSGILCKDVQCVLCDGVVVNMVTLAGELTDLRKKGAMQGRLAISRHSHLVIPYHCQQDTYFEEAKGKAALGTTRRGIGPAYADKYFRVGLRAGDMLNGDFRDRVQALTLRKNVLFEGYYHKPIVDPDAVWAEIQPTIDILAPLVDDTVAMVRDAADRDARILCEGAQGTLLDIDYGTYPYVTSSHPVSGGMLLGTGLNWQDISKVIGVTKAYTTRVGAGPFPTEETGEVGIRMREAGAEYGTVTKRPRRCGWLDLPLLKYAARLSGFTELALTKTDVLDDFDEIRVCVGYTRNGAKVDWPDLDEQVLESYVPVYEAVPGWRQDTTNIRDKGLLPAELRSYIAFIEDYVGVPVAVVSVGPGSDAIVDLN